MLDCITILLTQNRHTIISPEDADLAGVKWSFSADPTYQRPGAGVARRTSPENKMLQLHRVILARMIGRPLRRGEQCDHVNGDTLDNRRENLRVATCQQNMYNTGTYKRNGRVRRDPLGSVLPKGVIWFKPSGRYCARIQSAGKLKHLGYFDTIEEASAAYEQAARALHGAFYYRLS